MEAIEIWIVEQWGGEYEDKFNYPVKAFADEAKAKAWANEQTVNLRALQEKSNAEVEEFYKLVNKLGVESDDMSDMEYYEAEQKLRDDWVAEGKACVYDTDTRGYHVSYRGPIELVY